MSTIVDIETSPQDDNPDNSLNPFKNKIDLIAIHENGNTVVKKPDDVNRRTFMDKQLCGHNFKFDIKTLVAKGYQINCNQYEHDTLVMAVASITKVSDDYLERYEQERRRLNKELGKDAKGYRSAKKHSLKILAPYFLGVSPFWEDPYTCNNEEYAKKDALYTSGLKEHFIPMLKKMAFGSFIKTS